MTETKTHLPLTRGEVDMLLAAVTEHAKTITDHPKLREVLLLEMRLEEAAKKLRKAVAP